MVHFSPPAQLTISVYPCGYEAFKGKAAYTYHKTLVRCKNCRRTKVYKSSL